ncbi:MFS transporter [Lactobacillus acidophilus]
MAQTYHESLSQISWLVSAFAWTYATVTPLLALFTNKIHKYYLLITLLLIFLTGTILSSCAPSIGWLLFSRIITASVAGMIESLLSVIVYQLSHNQKQHSMMIAWIYTGFSIASVVGVPLGTIIADHWRWQDAFIMCAVITAVATVIALLVLPKNLKAGEGNYRDQIQIFKDKTIWYGIGFVICAAATLYGYYTYIRPLVHIQLKFDLNALSLILLLLGVVDIFANQVAGRIAANNGFKKLRYVYVLNIVLLALFGLMIQNQVTGITWIFILGFTVAIFGSTTQVFFLNEATKKYPAAINLASTLSAIFYNVGIALSS